MSIIQEVKVYTLSPEELAKYRALPLPEEALRKQQKNRPIQPVPKIEKPVVKKTVKKKEKKPRPPRAKKEAVKEKKEKRQARLCAGCSKKIARHSKTGMCRECNKVSFVPKICSIDGCERRVKYKGLCNSHVKRLERYGTAEIRKVERICSIDGCDKKHFASDYCVAHYNRLRKYGSPYLVRKQARKTWILVDERTGEEIKEGFYEHDQVSG